MTDVRGVIAYELTKRMVIDISTARACVDAAFEKTRFMPYEQALLNLLARIHRDGGHYVRRHGIEKAVEAADAKIVQWLAGDANERL